MQFAVERNAFVQELARVTGVIEKKISIPILSNVRIDAGAKSLALRATDLDIQAETVCPAQVAIQGVTTVDGRLLHDAVKRSPDGCTVSMTLDVVRKRMKLVAGRSRFEMPVLDADDYPSLDLHSNSATRSFQMDAAELRALVDVTRHAVGTDETRPYLHGVYLHQAGEMLAAAATDGHRGSFIRVPLPAGATGMEGAIMSRKLFAELIRSLPEKGELAIEVSHNRFVATLGEFRIVSRLLAGTYPDYERIIPQFRHCVVVDRKRLIEGIERVSLVSNEKADAVQLDIEADGLRLACKGGVHGVAFDEFDAVVDGPPVSIGLNARYLRDSINAATGARIVIGYADAAAAIVIRAENDEELSHRLVIMPMRVPAIEHERKAA
jgi:DNA polymerase-3 subunit beta